MCRRLKLGHTVFELGGGCRYGLWFKYVPLPLQDVENLELPRTGIDDDGQVTSQGASPFALWIALATVGIKIMLFFYVRKLGEETQNPIVLALAYDHRNDVFSASAASVGIFLGQRGLPWVDPLAGALVAILILRTGIFILRESSLDLMDNVPSVKLAEQILAILKKVRGVKQLEEVQAHRFGPHIVVNLTIGIEGKLTVIQGDKIATRVDQLIYDSIPNVLRVHVHYHPASEERANMTIDEILMEGRQHLSPHQPEYYDRSSASQSLSDQRGNVRFHLPLSQPYQKFCIPLGPQQRTLDQAMDGKAGLPWIGQHVVQDLAVDFRVTDDTVAVTSHGAAFASIVSRGLVFGAQFHPEKSGQVGLAILRGFLDLCSDPGANALLRAASRPRVPQFTPRPGLPALSKRIIACPDVRDGVVVKGVQFEGLAHAGDPALLARRYNAEGIDEVVILGTCWLRY